MRFQTNPNSFRQKVFRFLHKFPYASNQDLYTHFNAKNNIEKGMLRKWKSQFYEKFGKPDLTYKPKMSIEEQIREEKIRRYQALSKQLEKRLNRNSGNPFFL